jgi:predicted transcriptional regulator
MTDTKPNKRYKRVQIILDMIDVKAQFQARCFNRDLEKAIEDGESGKKDLEMVDILRIVNEYPLQRNRLLVRTDLDEDTRDCIIRSMSNPSFDPDAD